MVDLIAISQGLNALKGATDVVKTLVGLRDSAKLLETTVELNQQILSAQKALADAQTEQATLVETINTLEAKIAAFEQWDGEKQRYELKQLGSHGVYAYAIKEEARGSEPMHWICPDCYENRHKSRLQQVIRVPGRSDVRLCQRCGWEAYVQGIWQPEHSGRSASRRR
jgi:hypothetical protein